MTKRLIVKEETGVDVSEHKSISKSISRRYKAGFIMSGDVRSVKTERINNGGEKTKGRDVWKLVQ